MIVPGLTHWNHPGFFAYFAITASAPGILAEFLSAALNQQAMLWRTSPAATELEEVTLGWLRALIGLPQAFDGVIYDTASISTLHALAAAREAALPQVRAQGLAGRSDLPGVRVYCSEHAHSSVDKAVILLGLGHDALVRIPADAEFRMRTDRAGERDRRRPCGRAHSDRGRRDRREHVEHQRGFRCGRSPRSAARADLAARRRRLRRRRGDGARLRMDPATAPTPPIPSSSIRTSGCSRRSI